MEITKQHIEEAHKRIKPFIHKTPVLTSKTLDQISGAEIFFKCENFQKIGAFKIRGGMNAVLSLPEEKRKKYKEASYNINKFEDVNDSTAIINYSNSYMNKPMEIKLVRANKIWAVDFKYTFSGNLPIN